MLITFLYFGSYIVRNCQKWKINWKLISWYYTSLSPSSSAHNNNKMSNLPERFEAAVRVIQSLPKDGPYQPSNSTKLRFYGLYKQATEGKCNQTQPSRFSIINRAKWDAWNKLGEMNNEDAMTEYIEELKKAILIYNDIEDGIVETMPFSGDAQEFLSAINPFYEFVNLEGPEMKHVKQNLDEWTTSSSVSSSAQSSPVRINGEGGEEEQEVQSDVKENEMNGYIHSNSNGDHQVYTNKGNGLVNFEEEGKPTGLGAENHKYIAPGAPTHRASLNSNSSLDVKHHHVHSSFPNGLNGLSSQSEGSSSDSSDEILKVDVEEDTKTSSHSPHQSRLSVDTVNSGTDSSDKYYSGDSDPEEEDLYDENDTTTIDVLSTPSTLVGGTRDNSIANLYPESHYGLNSIAMLGQYPNSNGPVRGISEPRIIFDKKHSSTLPSMSPSRARQTEVTTDQILRSTVDRLNRDVDHILARLRILEAAYASNGQLVINNPDRRITNRRGPFRDVSYNTLTLILTWPFVAYFIIRLVNLWVMSRRRR